MRNLTSLTYTRPNKSALIRPSKFALGGLCLLTSTSVCLFSLCLVVPRVEAQVSSSLSSENERAVVRSQESLLQARSLMKEALQKRANHNLDAAYQEAAQAIQLAPSGSAVGPERAALVADYTRIALDEARELIRNGRYQDAENVAKSVLEPSVNPGNNEAIHLLADLEQPEVFNKTVTPKFAAQRDQVVKLLRDADGLAQSGRSDLALKAYDEVLLIDPYNTAARKGMEAVHATTTQYANEAYNETRSRMLWQVDKAWERPAHSSKQGRSTESAGRQQDLRGTDEIVAKLNSIIIPKIDLNDSPVSEAVEYLKQKSIEQDPNKKGVNIFLHLGDQNAGTAVAAPTQGTPNPAFPGLPAPATPTAEPHVTLSLTHVPLFVALDYLSKLANLKIKIDPYAVSIVPLSEPTDIIVQKTYLVPPSFIPPKPLDTGAGLPQAGPQQDTNNLPRIPSRYNAQEYLSSLGVEFPTGASANYLPSGSKLIVRNTRDNIDQIDALVDAAMSVTPSQVDITTKFLEITQNNIQELGFDWMLGPFSIGGGVYGSGGGGSNSTGMNSVGSLRTGNQAIGVNSIASLIAGQYGDTTTPAPGIFSISGIFNNPQFQMMIQALNQKKGIDMMSAPKVTTKSGVQASVKIVDEFIYPDSYAPPAIPQTTTGVINSGNGINGNGNNGIVTPPTVAPSFPQSFKTQKLGVILDVTPTIGPDGYTIDLDLHPIVTDFEGFINYGSPINSIGSTRTLDTAGLLLMPTVVTLTTNTINQPVFNTREVTTFVTVGDGETVSLGGLITESVQKTQDKVPFLGDIPVAGRLFRSDSDHKVKENLVIFVTPRILNVDGQPRREETDDNEIETVKPIGLPQDLPQPTINSPTLRTK